MVDLEERKKSIKKDAELLKQDIIVLNKLVAHIEEHLDNVSDETIENFDLIAEHLMDELQIVELYFLEPPLIGRFICARK